MRGPNLSEWALRHGAVMRFFIVLTAVAGILAFEVLGRQEDPDFTVKNMIVAAAWPGASAQEVADQLAEPIERAIQTIPEIDYIKTDIQPGQMIANVRVRDSVSSRLLPDIWTKVRQSVGDRVHAFPDGVMGPVFNDNFGDTYGNIYAFTGDGYSLPQLQEFADRLRDQLRQLKDAGRVEFVGEPEERIYIEYQTTKLANLAIPPQLIVQTLRANNAVAPAGIVDTGNERIRVNTSGTFDSVEAIRSIGINTNGRTVRLGDAATVRRALADPPSFRMRFNGKDAVGVMVSLRKGGDVTRLGRESRQLIKAFRASLPLGVHIDSVANQPAVVENSIGEFTKSLAEAIIIVLVVSFFALGKRPGLVVALSIPIVLAVTFVTMLAVGIPLHRVSLGALIIALGLLVDDAMIVIEQIDSHLHAGWNKMKAVTSAYRVTAQPMLVGTLVTMFGFLPIAFAQSLAGEYASSIFYVVAISLAFSWIVAVFVTPYIANWLLPENSNPIPDNQQDDSHGQGYYNGRFYTRFRASVRWSLNHRWCIILTTIALFIGSLGLFAWGVPKQFFPSSDRPELIVDLRAPQNASFEKTMAAAQKLEKLLEGNPDIRSITTYVGGGSPRFYLPLDVQMPNITLAQLVILTTGNEGRERVRAQITDLLATEFPGIRGRTSRLELGPPVGQAFKIRLSAQNYEDIAPIAEKIERLLRTDPNLTDVNKDYGETFKTLTVDVDQDKVRSLGITSLSVEQALQEALEGALITRYREADKSLLVVARLSPEERNRLDRISQISVPTPLGQPVPLSQVARLKHTFELAELSRRSSLPTITIQADIQNAQPAEIAAALKPQLDAIRATLPPGVNMTFGGSIEESAQSQRSVFVQVPIAFGLILLLLIFQLQSNKKMILVVLTGPLALIGVALVLGIFRIPFGFVAMLGGLSLFGMVIRNSIILVSQIDALHNDGVDLHSAIIEATVHRLRPIMLTALAAILAMIPLSRSVFWGPMAWSIMGGLMVATLLTLFFLPAVYAAAYGAKSAPQTTEPPAHA